MINVRVRNSIAKSLAKLYFLREENLLTHGAVEVEMDRLRQLILALVGMEDVVCASGSGIIG